MIRCICLFLALVVGVAQANAGRNGTGGAPIFGLNMSGAEYWQQGFPVAGDWAYLQSKGITLTRMPVAWENLQPSLGGALDPTFSANLKASVALANTYNIGVTVDLHNGGCYVLAAEWGNPETGAGGGCNLAHTGVHILGDGTLTQANLTDIWTKLATLLSKTPGLIGYDIMNEPSSAIAGTNLMGQPNYFGNTIGCPLCWTTFGATGVQMAVGTNPVNSLYGPAWQVTFEGSGLYAQNYPSSISYSSPYTLSLYAKDCGGGATQANLRIGDVNHIVNLTTSWQRFSTTLTPVNTGNKIVFFGPVGSNGSYACFADVQFEAGSSATTYVPSTWQPYAQAAVSAIRAVDTQTPIYLEGQSFSCTAQWQALSWDLAALSGGPFVFEGHTYFDTNSALVCGSGSYASDYTTVEASASIAASLFTPFVTWAQETGNQIVVGEYAIPNTCCVVSPTDNNVAWTPLMGAVEAYLLANKIPSTMWFYNTQDSLFVSNILNLAPALGVDDPRIVQMLLYRK